ncbi:TolB family protein [Lentiprolixibacter aurantiacus]|uniref:Transporter n=1 Tax=Lentiprolixibacter aurantiacus TaxID=2993939 RepID=A0AAE3MLS6_9FLAO|nr:transporter [Lentiprolixibacter aurantiacus]MCX2719794.1 transporter [Lentiprolixibacter aurantiacus]
MKGTGIFVSGRWPIIKAPLFFLFALLMNLLNAQENSELISQLETYALDTGKRTVVLTENAHFEAPNWSTDGSYLLINQEGKLYRVYLKDSRKEQLNSGMATRCNNDHGISFSGKLIAISNNDPPPNPNSGGSRIYVLPVTGGKPELITPNAPSYWHGWSPDDKWLVYVAERGGEYDIYKISLDGGDEIRLTDLPGLQDGPEYSPDGKYIYYNSAHSGSMELWRMDPDGKEHTQLTDDKFSNWFPHPSPDGRYLVYLSYLQDQGEGHPPMKEVALKLMDLKDKSVKTLTSFTGGQGTINVPSWSPDSKHFAFVTYRYK